MSSLPLRQEILKTTKHTRRPTGTVPLLLKTLQSISQYSSTEIRGFKGGRMHLPPFYVAYLDSRMDSKYTILNKKY